MKTWNDYKDHVNAIDPVAAEDITEAEKVSSIISAVVKQRTALGISQRELAAMCGMPQSSVARMESFQTMPSLSTLLKILQPLGLELRISAVGE